MQEQGLVQAIQKISGCGSDTGAVIVQAILEILLVAWVQEQVIVFLRYGRGANS